MLRNQGRVQAGGNFGTARRMPSGEAVAWLKSHYSLSCLNTSNFFCPRPVMVPFVIIVRSSTFMHLFPARDPSL